MATYYPHKQLPIECRPSEEGGGNRWTSHVPFSYRGMDSKYEPPFYVRDSLSEMRKFQDAKFDEFIRKVDKELGQRSDRVGRLFRNGMARQGIIINAGEQTDMDRLWSKFYEVSDRLEARRTDKAS